MKKTFWVLAVFFFFLSTSLLAQEKTISLSSSYREGETFRYTGKIKISMETEKKGGPASVEIEISYSWRVVKSFGKKALVAFQIEKIHDSLGLWNYPAPQEKQWINLLVENFSLLRFKVGPCLQIEDTQGMEKFLSQILEEKSLPKREKSFILWISRFPNVLLNRWIKEKNGYKSLIFAGSSFSEKESFSYETPLSGMGKIKTRGQLTHISIETKGEKKATFEMGSHLEYNLLSRLLGYKSTKISEKFTVDEKTIPQKMEWKVENHLKTFLPFDLNTEKRYFRLQAGFPRQSVEVKISGAFERRSAYGPALEYKMISSAPEAEKEKFLEETRNILNKRFFHSGLWGVEIQKKDSSTLSLLVPSDLDSKRVQELVEKRGKLSFKILHSLYGNIKDEIVSNPDHLKNLPLSEQQEAEKKIHAVVEEKKKGLYDENKNPLDVAIFAYPGKNLEKHILLENESSKKLDGKFIQKVSIFIDAFGQDGISLELSKEGGKKLSQLTGNHIGQILVVVMDGKILMMPKIQSQVQNRVVISGRFSRQEIQEMIALLKEEALPGEMKRVK